MKRIVLFATTLMCFVVIKPMHNQHLSAPKPRREHNHLYAHRLRTQLPLPIELVKPEPIERPATPRLSDSDTPPRQTSAPAIMDSRGRSPNKPLDYTISMSPMSPQEQIQVEHIRANAVIVQSLSKKKIAVLVAASAITSSVLRLLLSWRELVCSSG